MKRFQIKIQTGNYTRQSTLDGSRDDIAVKRAVEAASLKPPVYGQYSITVFRLPDVKYEYRICADVKDPQGNSKRTTLVQYGPYKTVKDCDRQIDFLHKSSHPPIVNGEWKYLRSTRSEKP